MRSALRTLLLLALLGLAACGPRYQSVYRYEAPADATGRACLEGCAQKMADCREQCTTTTQACLKKIEPLVDEHYNAALQRHEAELDRHRQEQLHYDLYLALNWGYPWRHGFWSMPYHSLPTPPTKPSRNAVFEQLRHERCDVDCGCQSVYDACFLACGGKKIPEIQCISNCPR